MIPAEKIFKFVRAMLETGSAQSRSRRIQRSNKTPGIELLETRCLLSATRPQLAIANVSVMETDTGDHTALVTVSLSAPSLLPVTVRYATRNRTAATGLDYQSASGTLTIPAGVTSASIPVLVIGDAMDENNETFVVVLTLPTNATISKGSGTVTIIDDDLPPSISVSDILTREGNTASLVISLSSISSFPVTVVCKTSDVTALNSTDYLPVSQTVTIPAGKKSTILTLRARQDIVDEPDEKFLVTLSSPSNATLAASTAFVIIQDDDLPAISIADVSIVEGSDATSVVQLTVQLSSVSLVPVTVTYATRDRTASSSQDYQRVTGVFTIPAGATSAKLTLSIVADIRHEPDETFAVLLSAPVNATISKVLGTVTIIDDDPLPIASVVNKTVTEVNVGTFVATIQVSLNHASAFPVTLHYQTKGITATPGTDFVNTAGSLTIPAGASSGTISVLVTGDVIDENDETFSIELSSPTNVTLSSTPNVITISDNDLPPLVTISNITVAEGSVGTTASRILVSLNGVSGLPVTLNFNSQKVTASAISDFVLTNGTLTIPAGQIFGTISFDVTGDLVDEPNEAFEIRLFRPVNARISKSSAIVTIIDDDGSQLPLFNHTTDFTYVGAFRVPAGTVGVDSFEYGGNSLAFNAANHSLFMASNVDHGLNIAEVQIPTTLSSNGIVSSMSVATVLQPFVNLSALLTTNASGTNEAPILGYEDLSLGGLLVAGNGLTGGMFMGYNGAEPQDSTNSHFRTTGLNLAALSASSFTGLIDIRNNADSASGRVRGGYMAEVPEQWKAWIGANYVTGAAGQNRIQYSSAGPALFGFDAINPGGSSDRPLVYYPYGQALQWIVTANAAPQLLFNGTTKIDGVAFVPGTRSVIFIGSNGLSSIGYGVGSRFNDHARPYQGFHSQDGNYGYQIWAYDLDDFMSVRNGTMESWQIRPTSVVNFDLPTPEFSKYLGGTAFDASTGRLYISQKTAGPKATPIIHVYQLGVRPASGFLAKVKSASVAPETALIPLPSSGLKTANSSAVPDAATHAPYASRRFIRTQTKFWKTAAGIAQIRSSNGTTAKPSMETQQLNQVFAAVGNGLLDKF